MGDLLKQGSDWLEAQRTRHASRTVAYQRGVGSVELAATIGRTLFEIDTALGLQERFESRDFLVLTADLVLGGNVTLPARGDRILETDGTTTFTYEVMAPGKEPHFRYSDPYRKTLRIHTKQVAEAAV
jgi:hypothetical protein